MTELAVTLERFNRKERNLLIRSILNHKETPLQLSTAFRQTLASKLNLPVLPETAWWATDYHMSWIAGALAVYLNPNSPLDLARPNQELSGRRLIEGNQEDIDLLIAAGQHLIMVEAKAYGAWSTDQIASKLERLDLLIAYYDQIKQANAPIDFHLVLMSPETSQFPPETLKKIMPLRLKQLWPDVPWIPFKLASSALEVTRCGPDGKSSAEGSHWKVLSRGSRSSGEE